LLDVLLFVSQNFLLVFVHGYLGFFLGLSILSDLGLLFGLFLVVGLFGLVWDKGKGRRYGTSFLLRVGCFTLISFLFWSRLVFVMPSSNRLNMCYPDGSFLALDLGSSFIKLGVFDSRSVLLEVFSCAVPAFVHDGARCEGDALAYVDAVDGLVEQVVGRLPSGCGVFLACQRSSFLLWDKVSGEPVSPLFSWQDSRASDWCVVHSVLADDVEEASGLKFSPHFIGPKLAWLFDQDSALFHRVVNGEVLFGTLECFLVWRWSGRRVHQSDLSMAARSLLVKLGEFSWSVELLVLFGVPRVCLPEVCVSSPLCIVCENGLVVKGSVADQSAAVLPFLSDADCVVVNLGTGGFVLKALSVPLRCPDGYLVTTVCQRGDEVLFAQEATLNGVGVALDRFFVADFEAFVQLDGLFCCPDVSGLGAPFWRADVGLVFSEAESALSDVVKYQLVVEGVLFRLAGVLVDWFGDSLPSQLIVTGGVVVHHPLVVQGLADCLQCEVLVCEQANVALVGLSFLSDVPGDVGELQVVSPHSGDFYLQNKFLLWQNWLSLLLS